MLDTFNAFYRRIVGIIQILLLIVSAVKTQRFARRIGTNLTFIYRNLELMPSISAVDGVPIIVDKADDRFRWACKIYGDRSNFQKPLFIYITRWKCQNHNENVY